MLTSGLLSHLNELKRSMSGTPNDVCNLHLKLSRLKPITMFHLRPCPWDSGIGSGWHVCWVAATTFSYWTSRPTTWTAADSIFSRKVCVTARVGSCSSVTIVRYLLMWPSRFSALIRHQTIAHGSTETGMTDTLLAQRLSGSSGNKNMPDNRPSTQNCSRISRQLRIGSSVVGVPRKDRANIDARPERPQRCIMFSVDKRPWKLIR